MRRVLFVCVHNAGRSQIAEAFVNHLAAARGLDLRAESAGTVGGKELNPVAVQVMEEAGVPMTGQHPKLLTREMVESADRIVGMGCGVDAEACPTKFLMTEDWGLDDPAGQPIEKVREIRDHIRDRVLALLDRSSQN
jgi:arsenate reductase (thioredoxin)